ncbi:MAG TPA: glycosyltransferase [Solirubrobacteraceae bacterium]|nr:glycosyltransferase [Solirubrobacteraceae bacterium]
MSRPTVTVIVPFRGPEAALAALGGTLRRLELAAGDEILIADNRPNPVPVHLPERLRLIDAGGIAAPGYARDRAAAYARGEWLVMLDADTVPAPGLLEAYFSPAPATGTAVLAGGIDDAPQGSGAAAAHAAARAQMHERVTLTRAGRPYAQTANCAVRAEAFRAVAGFDESTRWGEDADLCFRLADAGWGLEPRAGARVRHLNRASLPALLGQLSGHGAGAAWLHRRHPGEFASAPAGELARRAGSGARRGLAAALRGDRATAQGAGLELLEMLAFETGRLRSNRPRS